MTAPRSGYTGMSPEEHRASTPNSVPASTSPVVPLSPEHLSPCPFCGNEDFSEGLVNENEGIGNDTGGEATPWYRVICRECGVFTEGARIEAHAIAAWNRREQIREREQKRPDVPPLSPELHLLITLAIPWREAARGTNQAAIAAARKAFTNKSSGLSPEDLRDALVMLHTLTEKHNA